MMTTKIGPRERALRELRSEAGDETTSAPTPKQKRAKAVAPVASSPGDDLSQAQAAEVSTASVATEAQPASSTPPENSEVKDMRKSTSKKAARAKARTPVKGKTAKKAKATNGESKMSIISKLLNRANGCTTADVLEATGWPSVSMPAMAKALKVRLHKDKEKGKATRYRAA